MNFAVFSVPLVFKFPAFDLCCYFVSVCSASERKELRSKLSFRVLKLHLKLKRIVFSLIKYHILVTVFKINYFRDKCFSILKVRMGHSCIACLQEVFSLKWSPLILIVILWLKIWAWEQPCNSAICPSTQGRSVTSPTGRRTCLQLLLHPSSPDLTILYLYALCVRDW